MINKSTFTITVKCLLMAKKVIRSIAKLVVLFTFLFSFSNSVYANDLQQLVNSDQLTISAKIKNDDNIIAKQPVVIEIHIATNRWFAGGISVVPFAIEEVVMLANNEVVINGSKRIDGETWATQLREITLYPMKAGTYTLPSIEVNISVNQASGPNASGKLYTEKLSFNAHLPPELEPYADYVVTSNLSINVENGTESPQEVEIGNAITRTITFSAENVPAMMLPQLTKPELEGVSIYQKPANLTDQSNRGVLIGKRIESFTYYFEQVGDYTLAEQHFYWWNTVEQQLETVILPEVTWSVVGDSSFKLTQYIDFSGKLFSLKTLMMTFITLLTLTLLVTTIVATIRNRVALVRFYKKITRQQYRQQKKLFLMALSNKDYQQACAILYLIIDADIDDIETLKQYFEHSEEKQILIAQLLQTAYRTGEGNKLAITVLQGKKLLLGNRKNNKTKNLNYKDLIKLNK
ncbi:hypothetical protein RGQ13_09200 [Thalassotalea psychrophila]|uniref:BatD protein n=1 Tax=Thalassotalea psychrophila TaxID=3065647 RepID=A0ABY9TZX0_9GAMM|nr:hypothetical protein RGQ13_09200 [Colwelliaceae bacterium SQ149]